MCMGGLYSKAMCAVLATDDKKSQNCSFTAAGFKFQNLKKMESAEECMPQSILLLHVHSISLCDLNLD